MSSCRSNARWCLSLIVFILPLCAFNWDDVDVGKAVSGGHKLVKAAAGLSDSEEIQLGHEVAANLAARYGLDEAPTRWAYVNWVGQTVARHCDRKKIPYHFAILKSSEINAYAAPGGYLFVTDGLLDFLHDEAELAGVLAHEITHVTQRHAVKALRQSNAMDAAQDLAAAGGKDVASYKPLSDFSINLLAKGYSRSDELQADRLGTRLAARAGYDPTALRDSIERLKAQEAGNLLFARFQKTHPPAADRLHAIDHELEADHLSAQGQRLADRYVQNIRH